MVTFLALSQPNCAQARRAERASLSERSTKKTTVLENNVHFLQLILLSLTEAPSRVLTNTLVCLLSRIHGFSGLFISLSLSYSLSLSPSLPMNKDHPRTMSTKWASNSITNLHITYSGRAKMPKIKICTQCKIILLINLFLQCV